MKLSALALLAAALAPGLVLGTADYIVEVTRTVRYPTGDRKCNFSGSVTMAQLLVRCSPTPHPTPFQFHNIASA